MGRTPCCEKNIGLKKGPWTPEEDQKLIDYIQRHGHGSWRALPKRAGLLRCGKSCRLRWTNYLRPDIKRGQFSFEEEQTIIELHAVLGNKWSTIAGHLPGRTDNEIKNYWNTHLKKRLLQMGIDPVTHRPRTDLLGFPNIQSSFFNTSGLGNMAQWENARLEAEARLTGEYLRQALVMSGNGSAAADLFMRPCKSEFGNDQYNFTKAMANPPWLQQPGIALDYKGAVPQSLDQFLQTNVCSGSDINSGGCLSHESGFNIARFASPCSTLDGIQIKTEPHSLCGPQIMKSGNQFLHSEGDLPKQTMIDMNVGSNILSNINAESKVSFDHDGMITDQGYNSLGQIDNNHSCDNNLSHAATTLWAVEGQLQVIASDSMPGLISSTSCTSNSIYNQPGLIPFLNASTSSMGNTNSYREAQPEQNQDQAGKQYWSTMLKAVGTIPASHIISARQ